MAIYLGVDIGTTSAKCLAADQDGKTLALAQYPYAITHPRLGWAEQDPEDYWRGLVDCVGRCVAQCKDKGWDTSEIVALSMSTQGDTLVVCDESGVPVAPAISWMDARGEHEHADLLTEDDAAFWRKEAGQHLSLYSSACSIRWLAKNSPDIARSSRMCYVADFLAKRLCGRFATDVPSASWTPLFNCARREWSKPVMDILGVRADSLPEIMESGEIIGELLPQAADVLGLKHSTRLIAGAFDQAAAAFGAGACVGSHGVLSCGTAWVLYAVAGQPIPDENILLCCHVRPDEWGMVMPFTGGSAYDWLARTCGTDKPSAKSDAEPLIFIPHLYGEISPGWHSESKGSLLGLTMAHTSEDIRLALMRGLAFETRRNVEAAESVIGRTEGLKMVGGACKSDIWPQMIANAINRPVEVNGCVESACYGAAKLAAGIGCKGWTRMESGSRFEPVASDAESEDRNYRRYIRFYEALVALYQAEESILKGIYNDRKRY